MKQFALICGIMLWIGSVFALEFVIIHYGDSTLGINPTNWWIAGPAAIAMFFDMAGIIWFLVGRKP